MLVGGYEGLCTPNQNRGFGSYFIFYFADFGMPTSLRRKAEPLLRPSSKLGNPPAASTISGGPFSLFLSFPFPPLSSSLSSSLSFSFVVSHFDLQNLPAPLPAWLNMPRIGQLEIVPQSLLSDHIQNCLTSL